MGEGVGVAKARLAPPSEAKRPAETRVADRFDKPSNTTKTTKTKPNQNQSKKPNQNQTKTKPKPNQNQTKTKENRRQPVCQRMQNSVKWRVVYTWKSVYVTKRKTRRKTKYWPKLGKIL